MEESPIAIVYNEPIGPEGCCSEASRDVLDQVEAVKENLAKLSVPSVCVPFTRDVRSFIDRVDQESIKYAFNLCESVDENPKLVGHPAAVMDILGVSYTGSSPLALALTTDKLMTKHVLRANGIATPRYAVYDGISPFGLKALSLPIIVKPRFEDGSVGIDQESVFANEKELRQRLPQFHDRFGSVILEEYISGREFNVSLFGYPSPQVLPIAEILFDGFEDELYHIVGYTAKWDRDSFEYHHTPRAFPTGLAGDLEKKINRTALDCFRSFMLRDYGRVDMRVDPSGVLYVLEINANPCISPDAGFAAALAQGGLSYEEFVAKLFQFVQTREKEENNPPYYRKDQD